MPIDWKITFPLTAAFKPVRWLSSNAYFLYLKKFKKLTYFFDEYTRQVTVYQNGHGIISNSFIITVLNKDAFTSFYRFIDIHDACMETCFDPMEDMMRRDHTERFSKMGFWYEPNDLIDTVVPVVDEKSKRLEWKFLFNKTKMSNLNPSIFKLSYSISIPGMFPVTDCYFDPAKAPVTDYICKSYTSVQHKINKLNFIISLEKGIEIEKYPQCKLYPHGLDQSNFSEITLADDSDIFYNRYIGIVKNPNRGASTAINWMPKRKQNRRD